MPILALPHELITEILIYCSVEDIVRVESTCKHLHEICQTRAIWSSCMSRLDVDQAPSLDPFQPLDTISTLDLRNKAIGGILRHRSWGYPKQYHDMHVVDLPINRSPEDMDIIVEPRLLPGGKEVLILNCGRIELWSLVTKERLWELKSPLGRFSCAGFDFDVVEGGTILLVAILFEDYETTTTSPLRIYSIDLRSNEATILFERTLPPVFLFRMMLRGDFFIACLPRTFQTIVINWKKGEALRLEFVDPLGARIDPRSTVLADEELISFVNLENIGFSAIRLSLSSLDSRWSKAEDHTFWSDVSIDPSHEGEGCNMLPLPYPGQQERVVNRNDGFGPWILAHRVFTPIWKPNAPTEIFLAAYDCGPGGQTPTRLVSFRLQLSQTSMSTSTKFRKKRDLSLVSSTCAQATQLPWNSRSLSNSGRMFSLRSKLRCFSLFTDVAQPMNELVLGPDIVPCADEIEPVISSVEPWSGAIAIGMPGMVKVINWI